MYTYTSGGLNLAVEAKKVVKISFHTKFFFSRTLQAYFGGAVPFSSLYRLYTTSRK